MPKLKKRPTGGPPRDVRPREELPPGNIGYVNTWFSGPAFTDAFRSRTAPSPFELIERYKSLIFCMVNRNRNAVMRVGFHLMCDGSRRILGGRPRSACDPIRVSRGMAEHVIRSSGGRISHGAVSEIYEIRNHPMLDVLERPDPYGCFTRRKLIGLMTTYQDVFGHGLLVPDGNGWDYKTGAVGQTPPEHLWVVMPQYTTAFMDGRSPIPRWWQYGVDRLLFESTLWFRQSLSLRNPYGIGYSPMVAGTGYSDQEDRLNSVLDQALGLMPIPAIIATPKDGNMPPGDVERKRLEQDFGRRFAYGNAGGLHVNNGAWEFNTLTRPPVDLGAKEMSEYDLHRLAGIFDQPPTFYTVDTNLANLQAAREQHAVDGVEPRCWAIAETFTHFIQQFDRRLFFVPDPVIADDELKKAQVAKVYVDMGAWTTNEVTEDMKMPPKPYGNVAYVNKNLVPMDMLGKIAEQGIASQQAATDNAAKQLEFDTTTEPGDDADSASAERAVSIALQSDYLNLTRTLHDFNAVA